MLHQASTAPKTQASLPQNEKTKPSGLALNTEIEPVSKHLKSYLSLQSMIQDLNMAIERSTKLNENNQESIDLFKKELDERHDELREKIRKLEEEKTAEIMKMNEKLEEIKDDHQSLMNGIGEICGFLSQREQEEHQEEEKERK